MIESLKRWWNGEEPLLIKIKEEVKENEIEIEKAWNKVKSKLENKMIDADEHAQPGLEEEAKNATDLGNANLSPGKPQSQLDTIATALAIHNGNLATRLQSSLDTATKLAPSQTGGLSLITSSKKSAMDNSGILDKIMQYIKTGEDYLADLTTVDNLIKTII